MCAVICFSDDIKKAPRPIMGKHVTEIMKMPVEYEKYPHYSLHWKNYLLLLRREESPATDFSKNDLFEGQGVRRFTKSHFFNSIMKSMFSMEMLQIPKPTTYVHWGLYCLNDIVDIVAHDEPSIEIEMA